MLRGLGILMTLVATISCSSATEPEPEDEGLTAAEVAGLVELVLATGLFPSPLPQSNPWPCPLGGTAGRALRFSSPQPGSSVREGTVTLTDCGAVAGNRQYVVSGTITVDDLFVEEAGTIVEAEGSYNGTLSWELEDRSGACPLLLTVSVVSGNLVVTGSACGAEIEQAV